MLMDQRHRMTQQRQIILEELKQLDSHPTADEIYARVRNRLPRISLGTVYRNLESLSESGAISKLELGGNQRRFDSNAIVHYHIRCMRCGKMDDLPKGSITIIDNGIRDATSYDVVEHRLEFVGICPECRDEAETRT